MRLRYKTEHIANAGSWQELAEKAVQHAMDADIPFQINDYSVEISIYGQYNAYTFATIDYLADTLYPETERIIAESKNALGYVEDV